MLKKGTALNRKQNVIFVLWGEQFEEATAAIFATKLRQAGLCVKLVGLASQRPIGRNGLALYPDISLKNALTMADKAVCIILPCSASILKHVEADPRIGDLFQKSYLNDAQFVVANSDAIQKTGLSKMSIPSKSLFAYEPADDLIGFADDLAHTLAAMYAV